MFFFLVFFLQCKRTLRFKNKYYLQYYTYTTYSTNTKIKMRYSNTELLVENVFPFIKIFFPAIVVVVVAFIIITIIIIVIYYVNVTL